MPRSGTTPSMVLDSGDGAVPMRLRVPRSFLPVLSPAAVLPQSVPPYAPATDRPVLTCRMLLRNVRY
eukprot:3940493-Rhodomonas_salina.4